MDGHGGVGRRIARSAHVLVVMGNLQFGSPRKCGACRSREPMEQTEEALGEVCNMIAGSFEHKVNGLSERCALSPPSVVTGKDYRVHRQESEAGI
jgi:CheY-specific phosphatase CheX